MRIAKGKTKFVYLPVTTSTVFTSGDAVAMSGGLVIEATSSTTPVLTIGLIRHSIASTDSNYATARLVEVEVPMEKGIIVEATTASATASNIGIEYDLSDARTVNLSGTSIKIFMPVTIVSSTLVQGFMKFLGSY